MQIASENVFLYAGLPTVRQEKGQTPFAACSPAALGSHVTAGFTLHRQLAPGLLELEHLPCLSEAAAGVPHRGAWPRRVQ